MLSSNDNRRVFATMEEAYFAAKSYFDGAEKDLAATLQNQNFDVLQGKGYTIQFGDCGFAIHTENGARVRYVVQEEVDAKNALTEDQRRAKRHAREFIAKYALEALTYWREKLAAKAGDAEAEQYAEYAQARIWGLDTAISIFYPDCYLAIKEEQAAIDRALYEFCENGGALE